tara:strand:+ start:96 stop:677 length:582 start_codon:yes stop_codon:yes gene_type:complete
MKKVIQILLFLITIIIFIIFYQKYFASEQNTKIKELENQKKAQSEISKNNLIKNLRYDLNLQDNSKYMIIADESEVFYDGDIEMVKMTDVKAKFIDTNNSELIINADKALFNSATYNTNFNQNVMIKYQDNTILSENLDLDFIKNIVTIYNNVVYEGLQGFMKADNVKINLITKNVEIFMNDLSKKIMGTVLN